MTPPVSTPFICKPAHPESTLPNHLLYLGFHTLGHYRPALITPGSDIKQLGIVLMPQDLPILFKLVDPKPVYPASWVPSHGNHIKDSCPHFPLAPSAS